MLAAWLANNWRPTVKQAANVKTRIRFTAGDLIWHEKRELVETELKTMLGLDTIDFSLPEIFQNRTTAIKRVLDNMSVGERELVDVMVEKYKREGMPAEIQRQ